MGNERTVVFGAGTAGAVTAHFLARRGEHNVLMLDRERIAGTQST